MADLRVVGTDAENLLLVDAQGGGHRVPIDDALHDALRASARVGDSRLTPREIQERLRGGASIEKVAQVAGVSTERIRRWQGPVLAERANAVELALRTRFARPPDGAVSGPLGRLVTQRLDTVGLLAEWDAWRGSDGAWIIQVSHQSGHAQWRFDGGSLSALDPQAEALGYREPPRAVDSIKGGRGRKALPSWESILEGTPPPNAFPT